MMADEDACFACSINERLDLPPREWIYVGPGWRVAHAFGTALPGWLVLVPRRHVTALDDMCSYRLHDGARPHSHVSPPWCQAMVWSRSQRAAGRPQPGAVHRALRTLTRCWSLRLGR